MKEDGVRERRRYLPALSRGMFELIYLLCHAPNVLGSAADFRFLCKKTVFYE
jgi:hypothetical protein